MELQIVRMTELNEPQRKRAIELFVEGFISIFNPISKDKAKLAELFGDALDSEMAIACLDGEQVVGMLSCGNSQKQPIDLQKKSCLRVLGKFKGTLVYLLARPMLLKPKVTDPKEGYLDYLTTDPALRGRGVATKLMTGGGAFFPYERFSFEVLEKNETAIRLYKKMGCEVVKVKRDPFAWVVGQGRPIIMRQPPPELP